MPAAGWRPCADDVEIVWRCTLRPPATWLSWARSRRPARGIAVRTTIGVLTGTSGLISAVWVIADDQGLLRQLDAVRLA